MACWEGVLDVAHSVRPHYFFHHAFQSHLFHEVYELEFELRALIKRFFSPLHKVKLEWRLFAHVNLIYDLCFEEVIFDY